MDIQVLRSVKVQTDLKLEKSVLTFLQVERENEFLKTQAVFYSYSTSNKRPDLHLTGFRCLLKGLVCIETGRTDGG